MKKIFVIHTGGTISMQEDASSGEVKPLSEHPLQHEQLPLENVSLTVKQLFHLPSPHMTPKEMLELKNEIEAVCLENEFDGIVITHGTDTLEETAYFLDLTLHASIPIVITGAMRSSNEIGSDGLYNLISAIKVASCKEANELGVLVVMNDEIHSAKNVTKTHTSNIATFQSPQYGPIGIVNKRRISFHHKPLKKETYKIQKISKNVVVLKAYAGMDGEFIQALQSLPLDGLVIEALGQGNLPPLAVPSLTSFIQQNIPVVIVSRCFNGIVQDVYAYEGGGKHLKDIGVILSNGLNGQKARIKLMILLELYSSISKINELFSD